MKKLLVVLLLASATFAQTPPPVTFDSVAFWNSPDSPALAALKPAAPFNFSPQLSVYMRPVNGAVANTFIIQVTYALPNQTGPTPPPLVLTAAWIPSMANSPTWLSVGTSLPAGTVLGTVTVQMTPTAPGVPAEALVR